MPACKIEWLTVPSPDLDASKAFYEGVFGFSVSQFSDSYWVFKAANLSGGLDQELEPSAKGIGFSITVDCINDTLTAIEQAGGEIIREGYSLGQGAGYCARFKDPNGNLIELYSEVLESTG